MAEWHCCALDDSYNRSRLNEETDMEVKRLVINGIRLIAVSGLSMISVLAQEGGNKDSIFKARLPGQGSTMMSEQDCAAQVKKLQSIIDTQNRTMEFYRSLVSSLGDNSVRAPFGKFFLIRRGSEYLALRFIEHTRPQIVNRGGSKFRDYKGARYEWYLQSDGSMNFSKPNVRKGIKEITETEAGPRGSYGVIDVGSFLLRWSLSDWIYFPDGDGSSVAMALTEWVRIEEVNPQDELLRWITKETLRTQSRHTGRARVSRFFIFDVDCGAGIE
jgi:hypothetical protein